MTHNFVSTTQHDIQQVLEEILPSVHEIPQRLHQAIRYTVLAGGKNVRQGMG